MNRKLSTLGAGEKALITKIIGSGETVRRLMDIGMTRGSHVQVVRIAPMGDPMEVSIGSLRISLRRTEAEKVIVTPASSPRHPEPRPMPTIALAGNPNSGKSATFNVLCGACQRVGNWAGCTVELTEGESCILKSSLVKAKIIDLPGIYSLTPYSEEEIITRDFLIDESLDLLVNVIDSTNLERGLNLTMQLLELDRPMVVALNFMDEAVNEGLKIDVRGLSLLIGVPVVPIVAVAGEGITLLKEAISGVLESAIRENPFRQGTGGEITVPENLQWRGANKIIYGPHLEKSLQRIVEILEGDPELTNRIPARWLAVKLIERDEPVFHLLHERTIWLTLEPVLQKCLDEIRSFENTEPETFLADERVAFIRGALRETVTRSGGTNKFSTSDRLDRFLLNRWLGLPVFLLILWCIFQLTFTAGEFPSGIIEDFFGWLKGFASSHIQGETIRSLIVEGIISGVGGVLIFLPNIMILFICLSVLEDTGYMARITFLVDNFMHRIGLHGRSFLPMIMGFGCSVPAIMACRTFKNRGDRLTTMLIIPLMSCGARFPVYILLASAFFPPAMAGNMIFGLYLLGVLLAVTMAMIFKKTLFKGLSEPFVMELPPYRFPTIRAIFMTGWNSCYLYLRKAGTVILGASVVLWFALNYPAPPPQAAPGKSSSAVNSTLFRLEHSAAGRLGNFIEPALAPLGFDWKVGLSLLSGLAAKEVTISTMSIIYSANAEGKKLGRILKESDDFTPLKALTLMIFVLIYIPCLATVVVFHNEAGGARWTALLLVYTTALAWIVSFAVAEIGALF